MEAIQNFSKKTFCQVNFTSECLKIFMKKQQEFYTNTFRNLKKAQETLPILFTRPA